MFQLLLSWGNIDQDGTRLQFLREEAYLPREEKIASEKYIERSVGYDTEDVGIRDARSAIAPCCPDRGVGHSSFATEGFPFCDQTFGDFQPQPVDNFLGNPIFV